MCKSNLGSEKASSWVYEVSASLVCSVEVTMKFVALLL